MTCNQQNSYETKRNEKIEYSHNSATDIGEHSTSAPKHAAGIAPCKAAADKVPGMSHKELAAQKAYKSFNYRIQNTHNYITLKLY